MRYRKKPVEISAVQLRWDTWSELCEEILHQSHCIARGVTVGPDGSVHEKPDISDGNRIGLEIETLEGTMLGVEGDYIILGVEGEIYPCRSSIFDATYEPVDPARGATPWAEVKAKKAAQREGH